MPRTKSLLFDDDVVETFAQPGMHFTIDEVLAKWQRGEASADVTRRACSQAMAALVAVPVNEGGWDTHHFMAMQAKLLKDYPTLWAAH